MSGSDDELDDLIRRVFQATDPLRGRTILPMTMTPAELRQVAERRWSYKLRIGWRRLLGLPVDYYVERRSYRVLRWLTQFNWWR